jgi:hypothetical protein
MPKLIFRQKHGTFGARTLSRGDQFEVADEVQAARLVKLNLCTYAESPAPTPTDNAAVATPTADTSSPAPAGVPDAPAATPAAVPSDNAAAGAGTPAAATSPVVIKR